MISRNTGVLETYDRYLLKSYCSLAVSDIAGRATSHDQQRHVEHPKPEPHPDIEASWKRLEAQNPSEQDVIKDLTTMVSEAPANTPDLVQPLQLIQDLPAVVQSLISASRVG
jgi:hypothetical protein